MKIIINLWHYFKKPKQRLTRHPQHLHHTLPRTGKCHRWRSPSDCFLQSLRGLRNRNHTWRACRKVWTVSTILGEFSVKAATSQWDHLKSNLEWSILGGKIQWIFVKSILHLLIPKVHIFFHSKDYNLRNIRWVVLLDTSIFPFACTYL